MHIVDSHCHLNFKEFQDDLDDVVRGAFDQEVKTLLTINTTLKEAAILQEFTHRFENVYCSVGAHPHDASEHVRDGVYALRAQLDQLIQHHKTIAIGESGLDYHYTKSPKEDQIASFMSHLECAAANDLPIIIHTREADVDTINCLDQLRGDTGVSCLKGVFHCFSGSYELATQALDRGFYISFSGIITFKKSQELRDIVKKIPLNRILVETDAPFLAPQPYRGKRNEPKYTRLVAEQVALLHQCSLEKVAHQTTQNFFALFSKAKVLDLCLR